VSGGGGFREGKGVCKGGFTRKRCNRYNERDRFDCLRGVVGSFGRKRYGGEKRWQKDKVLVRQREGHVVTGTWGQDITHIFGSEKTKPHQKGKGEGQKIIL